MMRRFLAYPTATKLWIVVIALISGAAFAVSYDIVLVQLYGTPSANTQLSSRLNLKAVPKRIELPPGEKVASALEGGAYQIDLETPPYLVEGESGEVQVTFNLLTDKLQVGTYKAYLRASGQFSILSLQPCQDQPLQQSIACIVVRKPTSRIEFKWTVDGDKAGSGRLRFGFAKPKINYFDGAVPIHWSDTDIDHRLSSTMTFRFNDVSKTVNPAEQPEIEVGGARVDIAGSTISLPLGIKTMFLFTPTGSEIAEFGKWVLSLFGAVSAAVVGTILAPRFQPSPNRKARKKHTQTVKAAGEEATSSAEKQSELDVKENIREASNSQESISKSGKPEQIDKRPSESDQPADPT